MRVSELRPTTGALLAALCVLQLRTDVSSAWEAWDWQEAEPATPSYGPDGDGYAVKLTLQGKAGAPFATPVTFGVPLPRGVAKDAAALGLFSASDRRVSAQLKPLAHWPDESVKWVLISFLLEDEGAREYVLRCGVEPRPASTRMKAVTTPDGVVVDTGRLRATFARGGKGFLESVELDTDGDGAYEREEQLGVPAGSSFIHLVDAADPAGRRAGRYVDVPELRHTIELVEAGPVRVVVKVAGEHINKSGRATTPYFIWVTFYAGQSFFKIWHTFVVAEPVSEVFVRTVGVRIGMAARAIRMRAGCDGRAVPRALSDDSEVYVVQDGTVLDRRSGAIAPACRIVEAEAEGERVVAEGKRGGGYIDVEGRRIRVTVCTLRTWLELPKELAVDNREAAVEAQFWPRHKFEPLDLRTLVERGSPALSSFLSSAEGEGWPTKSGRGRVADGMGMAKSHEVLCWVHAEDASPAELGATVAMLDSPRLLVAGPDYYQHCRALGVHHSADRRNFPVHDSLLTEACSFLMKSHQGVGFLQYGDLRRRLPSGGRAAEPFVAEWCNGGGEVAWPFFAEFLRTSERRYFDFAVAGVRHSMDVDTLHSLDTAAPSALPCTPGPDHAQAGTLADASPRTLLAYYLLTGNLRARDVLHELAEAPWTAGRAPQNDRELSKAVELAVALVEISSGASSRARLDRLLGQLKNRVARIGVDPVTGRAIDAGTGRPFDADLDESILPALAYGYRVTRNRSVLDTVTRCVGAAWPQFHCLEGLCCLYWATEEPAYAQAAAIGVRRLAENMAVKPRGVAWTGDLVGQSTWPQLCQGLAVVHAARTAVQPENLEVVAQARRHQARSADDVASDAAFEPIPLDDLCNWSPVAPAACTSRPELVTEQREGIGLKEGQIGFDFGVSHWVEPGFHCVTTAHRYPCAAGDPSPVAGFSGLPFGCTVSYCGIPFRLRATVDGDAGLAVEQKGSYEVAVNRQIRRLHLLGGVCLRPAIDSNVGARVVLVYDDGEEVTVDLRNFSDYQPCSLPPVFVKPSVKLAVELAKWHLNVLTIPVAGKMLSRVRLVGGDADHRVVVFGLTSEEARTTATPAEDRVEVEWELVSYGPMTRAFSAEVPKGQYRVDVELSAEAQVAFDVHVCGRRLVRHAAPSGRLQASLPAVWCDGNLALQCLVRPLGTEVRPEWGFAVTGVYRVGSDAEEAGDRATLPETGLHYGWEPPPEHGSACRPRSVAFPLRPRSDHQLGRLLGDGCAPSGRGDGRLRFWADVDDGQYDVSLYICSTSSSACKVEVRTVGADSGTTVRAEPVLKGGQYRPIGATDMKADARDGRLALEFAQQTGPRGQWAVCAVLIKPSP